MRILPCLLALTLAGCDSLDREAVILMVDPGYRAEILLDHGDGISSPDGLLWSDNKLYIADEGGSAVRRWVQGQPMQTLADARSGLSSPEDLALGQDGTLYVSDDDTGGVWRISPTGAVERVATSVTSSEGVAVTGGGMLLVGDPVRRRVLAVAPDGRQSPLTSRAIVKAESFAFDGLGNLYIADNREQRLYLRTPDGALHAPVANQGGFSPESLHFARGILFITDSENGKLHRYTPQDGLATIAVFAGSLANVQGITSDGSGNLYVSVQSDLEGGRGYVVRLTAR